MPQPISANEAPPKPTNDTEAQTDKEEKSSRKRTLESIGDNAAVQENALRKAPEKTQPAPTSHAHDVKEPKNKRSKSTDLTKEERLAAALSKAPKPSVPHDYLPLGQAITIPPRAAAAPAETASNPPLAKKRGRPKIDPATKKAQANEKKAQQLEEKEKKRQGEKEKKKADLQAKKAETKKTESTGVYAGEFALIAFRTVEVKAPSCADMLSLITLQ
jgi:DNA mismatch repair ATPase MutL